MSSAGAARQLAVARVRRGWERLRSSYWFIPAVMALLAIAGAVGMLELDRRIPAASLTDIGWLYSGGADGARAVLSTIGGSMITVAGVVFSISVVVLSLASSQFGPRLVRNFLRDTGNEVVLGTFIATFIYCLIVLRAVRGGEDGAAFVPQLSVTVGVGTGLLSLAVLIYYIQHVAASMRIENVIHLASRDVATTLDDIVPARPEPGPEQVMPGDVARLQGAGLPHVVTAQRAGYLEHIDGAGLVRVANDHDLVFELSRRPGDFVAVGEPIGRVWRAGARAEELGERLRERVFISRQRTPVHDLVAAVERLTEIAARALSRGINDPFTAVNCIDELSAQLARLAALRLPGPYRCDREGRLRLITVPLMFAEVLAAAYAPLRGYAASQPAVLAALLQALARIGRSTTDRSVHVALRAQADAVAEQVAASSLIPIERRRLQGLYHLTVAALAQ